MLSAVPGPKKRKVALGCGARVVRAGIIACARSIQYGRPAAGAAAITNSGASSAMMRSASSSSATGRVSGEAALNMAARR